MCIKRRDITNWLYREMQVEKFYYLATNVNIKSRNILELSSKCTYTRRI